jgi:hypothetical protein
VPKFTLKFLYRISSGSKVWVGSGPIYSQTLEKDANGIDGQTRQLICLEKKELSYRDETGYNDLLEIIIRVNFPCHLLLIEYSKSMQSTNWVSFFLALGRCQVTQQNVGSI